MSKAQAILALLSKPAGMWVSQWALLDVGGMRYGARLLDLRRQGYVIETKNLSGKKFMYRLTGKREAR